MKLLKKLFGMRPAVRIAPSPTGNLHIGTARTALFNFLFARKNGGKFIVRIEDTDKERSKKEFEDDILKGLAWLGLTHDELYRQSERTEVYVKYLKKLISDNKAYEDEVIRFRNPNIKVKFIDSVRGEIEFDTTELGDFVIAKSLTEPLYHLAVVVDDHEMGVTHIIRGEDHISNTPRQILIQEAIGAKRPVYAHLPLILGPDRSKMSKRHGATSIDEYRARDYLPEAIVNYLALLGWNPGTEQEIFSLKELIDTFDLTKVQKGGAIFDERKLNWIQKEHIKLLPEEERLKLIAKEVTPGIPKLNKDKICWKETSLEETRKHLETLLAWVEQKNFDEIMNYAEREGRGNVLWPLRYALSGEERSPDPITLIKIKGIKDSVAAVRQAIEILK